MGFHEHRELWLTNEWFWRQANTYPEMMRDQIDKEEIKEKIRQRLESILPNSQEDTQTEYGQLFETLADLTDDDGALAELQDLGSLDCWLFEVDQQTSPEVPPSKSRPLAKIYSMMNREKNCRRFTAARRKGWIQ